LRAYVGSQTDGWELFFAFPLLESLGNRSFSNNFDRTSSKLIGLHDSASSAGLPGFWIRMICATFHLSWKEALSEYCVTELGDKSYTFW